MTTFTRVLINPKCRGGAKLLTNPQAMHAAVRAAFPPDLDESDGRVLWRVDKHEHEHVLYIVGPEKPTTRHIVEQAGWETRLGESADYGRMLNSLMKGQKWRFELVANPTYSEPTPGKRGKVKAHVSVTHQLEWLYKRAEAAGFALAPATLEDSSWTAADVPAIVERGTDRFYRGIERKGRPVHIAKARFTGTLEVTDADSLRRTLVEGLGRSRAYGCGLLTLARVER
ncbi:type I-E CRISPR-associated protein Cas6/Cse3/CasE [Corynebacterium sanguinis]|uniref:type I-E CRISPR-associated protein Cas6/Cse3/CasE n=1 Tax=Corynebacterium sanguinis TaxID=2594913 RepID=UPI0011A47E80|nr:type I-E CRISPR-associated protein Cas6/Cse3/CasE [Corynebacterium sanguinis]MCT1414298.1 type I-E CRISPR-associated protein Cas6/Cse3/CasE [Corynebacterium sanguinis]MCT1585310.1 type I-E CRISPR-associated protein Cas6/Cse3/CasE [Corynebacterium sanguinis]MCT1665043.1 type I-E CRISPR-associated protein Cas6/Cse3/CasE [Corynebacterium sanguinis]MCT2023274.1 type I-E CRISPR-associated protein Cas6/Cse3/CasE [Corynebacterium sanguinis]MCT2046989.1 type I-E CRISPR-associated protein Cas6/Cse3/